MDRRTFVTSLGVGATVGLAGCVIDDSGGNGSGNGNGNESGSGNGNGDGGGNGDGNGDGNESGNGDTTAEDVNVGMVYSSGGLGDESFNDMAYNGVEQAEADFGISYQNAEPDSPADMNDYQREFAGSGEYDLVCCIGFDHVTDLVQNAQEFSDQQFVLVDAVAETEGGDLVENVDNYVFREHEGSFQVGHLAGLLTTMEYDHGAASTSPDDPHVGFVGGQETAIIDRFEAGYIAGAEYANEDIEVSTAYAGSWDDPGTGQEIATTMYDNGADIVFHAAGATGGGVFEAAQSAERYAIGVDDDQSISAEGFSDVIVASMVKRVNTAVYESIESVVNGEFEGGSVQDLGLEEDGVEAVIGQDFEGELPGEVTDALAETREGIIGGDIEVPEET
ncbi:BMP family lipoprotein [Halomontanus rarus]|uniref:BMP family lipoprotein n=1 Tax=Halomontanus rarus TaxID=3034020 RepID=UPI0023E86EB0|nr:BMP family protein [Halovivax sp. TS33]